MPTEPPQIPCDGEITDKLFNYKGLGNIAVAMDLKAPIWLWNWQGWKFQLRQGRMIVLSETSFARDEGIDDDKC